MANPLSDMIRKRMNELGLNQRSLAIEAGLHQDAVRNILRGRSQNPRIDTVQKLLKVLKLEHSGVYKKTPELKQMVQLSEHAAGRFRGRGTVSEVESQQLVTATLLVNELFADLRLNAEEIRETALKACRMAEISGSGKVTRTLVKYLRETSSPKARKK